MQRIIVHMGDKKTGSTAIQQALASGAWTCDPVSLDYAVPPGAPYHHALAHALATGDRKAATAQMTELARRVAGSRADVVVISSELLRDADPAEFRALWDRHMPRGTPDPEVLGYMRPHIGRFLSNYAQIVKLGISTDLPEWHFSNTLNTPAYRHAELFLRWRAVYGDRLTVRPMIRRELAGGDVVADFFRCVLGTAEVTLKPLPPANTSPSLQDIALLRRFHFDLAAAHADRDSPALKTARLRVGERLGDLLAGFPVKRPRVKLQIDRALARRIAGAYGADAARADAEFFGGAPLMQEALEAAVGAAPKTAPSYWVRDHFTPETVRMVRLLAGLIGEMLLHDPEGWNGHFMAILNRMLRGAEPPA